MRDFKVGEIAQRNLAEALSNIATAVGSTMGPGGMPFGFDKMHTDLRLTSTFSKDGLTVLRALDFPESPSWQAVLAYCRQASSHSFVASGDGPQPLYSKVLTPNGYVKMSDLRVGMNICGTNGTMQEVMGIFPKGSKEIYEVEFDDGRIVECCKDHVWSVTNYFGKQSVKTTEEISKDLFLHKNNNKKQMKYFIPRTEVEFIENDNLPLDPYFLGVLIGDGCLRESGSVEISIGVKKEHIIDKLVLPEGIYLSKKLFSEKNYYRVKFNGRSNGKNMHEILNSIGLLNTTSADKFIPNKYLYSSLKNRKALLHGLLDTDGYINDRGLFEFSTISESLRNDFIELVRSVGVQVGCRKHVRDNDCDSYSKTSIYRIWERKGRKYGCGIKNIRQTGVFTEMQCIKVSNDDHLYITDDYIVTHNTTSTIVLADAVAQAVMKEKTKYPQYFARLLESDAKDAIDAIKKEAIFSEDVVKKVAMTSCNGDAELADVVIEAIKSSSAFGSILVEKAPASPVRYQIDKQDGYSNCSGYNYNSVFALSASENAASSKAIEWENPYVAIFNGALLSEEQLAPITKAWSEACKENARNLVIVAFDVGDQVINKLLPLNRNLMSTHQLSTFVVKPRLTAEPLAGVQIMRDIASFTGVEDSKIIDGGNYKQLDKTFLGTCKEVKISQTNTAFLGRSNNHWVDKRIQQNQSVVDEARSDFDREIAKVRNAELAEGLVLVQIGGGMLPDIQERADRFDDASKAAQSCMKSGALPGGGCSYIRSALLAGVNPALESAFRSIYQRVVSNFGVDPEPEYIPNRGQAIKITNNGIIKGSAVDLDVLDACETVCAVILNGVSLGVKIATLGGYSYRTKADDPISQ